MAPPVPESVTGRELSDEVLDALNGLPGDLATTVARRLVMVGELLDDAPEEAWQHAQLALFLAARVGVVREIGGTAAYRVGRFDVALREFRAAKRMTGVLDYLPMMADCERALGRPEKAIELATSDEAKRLDATGQLELLIVASGAHLDLADPAAARSVLEIGELDVAPKVGSAEARQARARLFAAYATAVKAAGDDDRRWLLKAAEADVDGSTGAASQLGLDDNDYEVLDLEDFAVQPDASEDPREPSDETGAVLDDPHPVENGKLARAQAQTGDAPAGEEAAPASSAGAGEVGKEEQPSVERSDERVELQPPFSNAPAGRRSPTASGAADEESGKEQAVHGEAPTDTSVDLEAGSVEGPREDLH